MKKISNLLLFLMTLTALSTLQTAHAQSSDSDEPSDKARVYLYRPKSPVGMAVIYTVFIDDRQVGIAKNGFNTIYEVSEAKEIEIWGETEKKMSLNLKVEPGNDYFVKCAVKMGALTGRPKFTLETIEKGKRSYNKLIKD